MRVHIAHRVTKDALGGAQREEQVLPTEARRVRRRPRRQLRARRLRLQTNNKH